MTSDNSDNGHNSDKSHNSDNSENSDESDNGDNSVLVFFEAHFKLDFQALLSKLTSLNVSMFSCHRVKIQLGKQPTVSELDMDKIFLRAK